MVLQKLSRSSIKANKKTFKKKKILKKKSIKKSAVRDFSFMLSDDELEHELEIAFRDQVFINKSIEAVNKGTALIVENFRGVPHEQAKKWLNVFFMFMFDAQESLHMARAIDDQQEIESISVPGHLRCENNDGVESVSGESTVPEAHSEEERVSQKTAADLEEWASQELPEGN